MPDGPDEIQLNELEDGGISLVDEFDEQATELLELEAELNSIPGAEMGPNEQYESGMVIGAERVGVTDVPNTYPESFRSPNVLRLDVQLNPDSRTSVYLAWPEQLTGDTQLDRLLSTIDIPAHSFADILGREIPLEREESHYVVDLGNDKDDSMAGDEEATSTDAKSVSIDSSVDDAGSTSPYWYYVVAACFVVWIAAVPLHKYDIIMDLVLFG